jgi:hypothetical protein
MATISQFHSIFVSLDELVVLQMSDDRQFVKHRPSLGRMQAAILKMQAISRSNAGGHFENAGHLSTKCRRPF